MSHPSSIASVSVEPVRHLDELEELLIDAQADDEQVPHTPPGVLRPWLLLLGLVLVALINVRHSAMARWGSCCSTASSNSTCRSKTNWRRG